MAIKPEDDPLLALYGSGRDLWADEHADEYVRRLREGWDEAAERRENPPPAESSKSKGKKR
jgi:hypothetical protein